MSYNTREDVRPQPGKQTELFEMIANQEADFYLIGGSRFGGKSEIISMVDLLYAGDPKYRSIKFRRLFDEIMGANGLWEKAENQYKLFNAKPNKSDKSWTFPSGAKSLYRHMFLEGDEESHRGKGYSAVFFDEINQFTWQQVRMLQTCLRSEADMNSFMVGTLNPDSESWCMKFVDWYINPDTGFPDEDKCGKVRYYLIVDGEPVFAETEEYFQKYYYDLVNPIVNFETNERMYVRPKRFVFFFFNIFSNPIGMKMNPQYISELNGLPEHERQTQLFGNWHSRPESSSMFSRTFLKGLDPKNPSTIPEGSICVRAWDKAYKEPSDVYMYPDYTASIQMWKSPRTSEYYITGNFHESLHDDFKDGEDIIYGRFRKNVGTRDAWMLEQAAMDGTDCIVAIPKEGAAGVAEWENMRGMFIDAGFTVKGVSTGNKKGGKGLRFAAFCSIAEQGAVHILPHTFPNKATLSAYLNELENFDPDIKSTGTRKDDWVDVTSDCIEVLRTTKVAKPFTLPPINSPTKLSSFRGKH
jgi:phage terminase large subunit-like protein